MGPTTYFVTVGESASFNVANNKWVKVRENEGRGFKAAVGLYPYLEVTCYRLIGIRRVWRRATPFLCSGLFYGVGPMHECTQRHLKLSVGPTFYLFQCFHHQSVS